MKNRAVDRQDAAAVRRGERLDAIRRLNSRIAKIEEKVTALGSVFGKRRVEEFFAPLREELGHVPAPMKDPIPDATQAGLILSELFLFAFNVEEFLLGVISDCESSHASRDTLPGEKVSLRDRARGFVEGERIGAPGPVSAHIRQLGIWLVRILTGYKAGASDIYREIWDGGLKNLARTVQENAVLLSRGGKRSDLLEPLPPPRMEALVRERINRIILRR